MALQNCSFWDVMTLADKKRDVYVFGMDYTVTQEQIESFFSGLDMEEIYTIEPSRARIKKFYYIRFKDEENKKRALLKDKEILGNRYLEVHGIENPRLFGRSMLFQNTLNVRLTNLPFNVKKTEIIEWLEVEVSEEDIFFVKRGECVVCLPDKAASALVVQKNKSLQCIGERKIHVIPFVTKDDLGKLDICCKEEIQQEV